MVLALLGVDGVLSALMAAFFLPLRVGSVPFPVSALLSGVLNALLGGGAETDASRWSEQMLNVVAAGPVLNEGTPMADDALLYLRALAAAEASEHPVSTGRRAARLTP